VLRLNPDAGRDLHLHDRRRVGLLAEGEVAELGVLGDDGLGMPERLENPGEFAAVRP
jgi:hypothetical protein